MALKPSGSLSVPPLSENPCFRGPRNVLGAQVVAIPAGFEPAIHGVEIRSLLNAINDLAVACTVDVPLARKSPTGPFNLIQPLIIIIVLVGYERENALAAKETYYRHIGR